MSTQFNQMDSTLGQEKLAHTLVENALCHERTASLADWATPTRQLRPLANVSSRPMSTARA